MKLVKWLRDGWLILGVTLLLLLIVDAGLKSVVPQPGTAPVSPGATAPDREQAPALEDAPWIADYFDELHQARRTVWSSWEYWRRVPFAGDYINVNAEGIRSSWTPPAPEWVIWLLGGSTVWGTGARDDATLPSALARALQAQGIAARVINLGESGYVSGQAQVRFLRRLEQHPAPDLVVFYGGVNDVYAAFQAGRPGVSQNEAHRQADFRATDGLDNWLQAAPAVLEGVSRLRGALQPATQPDPTELGAQVARIYAHRVSASRAVAESAETPSLFFWQPTVFSRTSRPPSEEAIAGASAARHAALQAAADESVRQVMMGAPGFSDLSGVFNKIQEPLFLDFCHLSERGNALVAQAMLPQVIEALAPPLDHDSVSR
ncbi:MAG: SGNH/GDSL hydrolase family protein [Pseudomonadota bacterium]